MQVTAKNPLLPSEQSSWKMNDKYRDSTKAVLSVPLSFTKTVYSWITCPQATNYTESWRAEISLVIPWDASRSLVCVFPACLSCGVLWSLGLCVVLVWFSCSESFPFKHICGAQSKPPMLSTPSEVTPSEVCPLSDRLRVRMCVYMSACYG